MDDVREQYDAIVIGAGQGGVPFARELAGAGRSTLLVEEKHVGGTCINEGCTPTKTMVASARVAYLARRAADYGVQVSAPTVDMVRVRQRKRDIVESFRSGGERRISTTKNLTLARASGQFAGPKTIELRDAAGRSKTTRAEWIFLNTGGRPIVPPLEGLDRVPHLDSTSVMELDVVPEHLLVLGGGYIGLEFGQMMRRFGSRVTMVQRAPTLLAREDGDVCEAMAQILAEDGIEILLGASATRVAPIDWGRLVLSVDLPDGARQIEASHLLVAVGRAPNSGRLNLASAGVETDRQGFIRVNDRLETSAPGVWAMGDVKGGAAFTHISYDDFRILRTNLLAGGNATTAGRLVPYTLFTDPQLGRIGLTEREAREQGLDVAVAKLPMSYVARALELDESRGLIKAIVDRRTDQILGAAVLGIEGGELMAVLQMAMMGRVPASQVREAVFAHPTLAESLNNLFAALEA